MDEMRLENRPRLATKWFMPAPLLAGLLQEGHDERHIGPDVEGLLFGRATAVQRNEHEDGHHHVKTKLDVSYVISSYLVTGNCCSTYSSDGSVNIDTVAKLVQEHGRSDLDLLGTFVIRNNSPLLPSIREKAMLVDLRDKIIEKRSCLPKDALESALLILSPRNRKVKQSSLLSFRHQLFIMRSTDEFRLTQVEFSVPNIGSLWHNPRSMYENFTPLACSSKDFMSFHTPDENGVRDPIKASVKHLEDTCEEKLHNMENLLQELSLLEDKIATRKSQLRNSTISQTFSKEQETHSLTNVPLSPSF